MKQHLLLFGLLLAVAGNTAAQENTPHLVTEGKQWAVCVNTFTGKFWTETYRLQGDTVINGKTYKIEHMSRNEDLSDMKPTGRYMREENGKVYSITDKDQRDDFVFDYSMEIGDTLCYNPGIDSYGNVHNNFQCIRLVAVRDTVMPNGDNQVRKCYDVEEGWFDNGNYQFTGAIYTCIEDIGFELWGLSAPQIGIVGSWSYLLYVKQDDTMLYQSEEGVLWKGNTGICQFIDTYRGFMLYENNDCSSYYILGTHTIDGTDYVKDIDWRYFYRQDGNKIYCYSAAEKKEYLVMDFGLKVGDTFALYDGLTVKVEQQSDTLMTCWWNEAVCKTLYLRGIEQPDFTDVWIEGVGSLRYGINPPHPGNTHLIYSSLYTEEMDVVYGFDFLDNDVRGMLVELGEYLTEKDFSSSEEYEAAHANNRMTFGLRNDTLYVGGYFGSYCEEFPYFLVKEDGKDIWISTARYPYDPEADCRSVNVIDFKIPGFTQERYTVHFGSMEVVVTQGNAFVDDMIGELVETIYYDLMGRKVAHPTRGIYIKDGRKVLIK